jgi:hypothetical protein
MEAYFKNSYFNSQNLLYQLMDDCNLDYIKIREREREREREGGKKKKQKPNCSGVGDIEI